MIFINFADRTKGSSAINEEMDSDDEEASESHDNNSHDQHPNNSRAHPNRGGGGARGNNKKGQGVFDSEGEGSGREESVISQVGFVVFLYCGVVDS